VSPSQSDPLALSWLVTVRWASVLASVAAVRVGSEVIGMAPPAWATWLLVGCVASSNVALAWWIRRRRPPVFAPGLFVSADVIVLSYLLVESGGPLNPVSIFFLVYIVLAALVLGTGWAWTVAALAIAGYGVLFLAPHPEMTVAGAMHPEIGRHIAGMWWAFAGTALLVAVLVGRLAAAVARRDAALLELRERSARNARLAGLATLAAGATHELSTPLGTIAVAAHELERTLAAAPPAVRADLTLIQREVRRCRELLDTLAARAGQPLGEMPRPASIADVMADVSASLTPSDRPRFVADAEDPLDVTWPRDAVVRALANLVRNSLQASPPSTPVTLRARAAGDGRVRLTVADRGTGMTPDVLARLGEPFFTTRPPGSGLGLGVFVSQSTVAQLGGAVRFESTPGGGTTVTIDLPRHISASHHAGEAFTTP
jgi:two-component system sensor histidine kinase RegB